MATTYISRTSASTGNRKTWTFSFWGKREQIGTTEQHAYGWYTDSSNRLDFGFLSTNTLVFREVVGGSTDIELITDRLFRDPGAWMHIVVAVDTTESVAADRVKIYINGTQETSFSTETYPALNADTGNNVSGTTYLIGQTNSSDYWTGSMSWVQLVDGLALAPTQFGSTDATSGIWKIKPSAYGTPGTNGFTLAMEDRSNLDLDTSSNAFTFTTTGTGTATYDNPSNNFATFNPLNIPTANLPTYANGNTTVTTQNAGGSYFGGTSSLGMVAGKWYCEFKVSSAAVASMCGVMGNSQQQARSGQQTGYSTSGYAYISTDGNKKTNASSSAYGNSYGTSNVIGVALDLDNLKVYFAKDNTWQDSGDPTSGASGTGAAFTVTAPSSTPGGYYSFSCSDNASGAMVWDVNFGNGYFGTTAVTSAEADGAGIGAFEFAPPTGYYALCTKNIKAYGG